MNNDMRKLEDNLKVSVSDSDNESAVESMRIKFAQDMKNIQSQFEDMGNKMQNVKPYDEGKSSRIEWEQRMKRADFNKPGGMTDGDKGFVKYAASIKRWGHKLHNEFTKILEMVEGGKEGMVWRVEDFEDHIELTEELNRLSRAIYDMKKPLKQDQWHGRM